MSPALRTSAARRSASGEGIAVQLLRSRLEGTILKACGGGVYSSSWTSAGTMTAVGQRRAYAVRIARSSTFGSCSGTVTVSTKSEATSLNSECRSTSCWYEPPIALRAVCPTMASTGTWSSLASYRPLRRWIAPGPDVATHTPSRLPNFAYPTASNADISSCRDWMKRGWSSARPQAASRPLMPSPG